MAKHVLITGASRGIGAATARVFAAEGWNVALNYCRSRDQALALAAEEMEYIYTNLGNGINHELCMKFVQSGCDLDVIDEGLQEKKRRE